MQLAEELSKLASQLKYKNPAVSIVLFCLVSSMYIRSEQKMAETCVDLLGNLLKKEK